MGVHRVEVSVNYFQDSLHVRFFSEPASCHCLVFAAMRTILFLMWRSSSWLFYLVFDPVLPICSSNLCSDWFLYNLCTLFCFIELHLGSNMTEVCLHIVLTNRVIYSWLSSEKIAGRPINMIHAVQLFSRCIMIPSIAIFCIFSYNCRFWYLFEATSCYKSVFYSPYTHRHTHTPIQTHTHTYIYKTCILYACTKYENSKTKVR